MLEWGEVQRKNLLKIIKSNELLIWAYPENLVKIGLMV